MADDTCSLQDMPTTYYDDGWQRRTGCYKYYRYKCTSCQKVVCDIHSEYGGYYPRVCHRCIAHNKPFFHNDRTWPARGGNPGKRDHIPDKVYTFLENVYLGNLTKPAKKD